MISNEAIINARILIIDDNLSNLKLVEKTLEAAGYTSTLSTTDSRDAVELYQSFRPDLLILDINMPHLNGYQVMEKLKEVDGDDYLPVLVLTAQKDKDTRLKSLSVGAKDFLTKPFDKVETLTRVRNMLEVRLLYNEVNKQKAMLEKEHAEAEEIGASLLRSKSHDSRLDTSVAVFPSSKVSGDRAGYLDEVSGKDGFAKEWLAVFDATGHGRGAAKFQELALGGLFAMLENGHDMRKALTIVNSMLKKINTGRFLVGNIWRVILEDEKQSDRNEVWVEEINIAQHSVLVVEPGQDEVKEWMFEIETGRTLPLGIFEDGLNDLEIVRRKVREGSRIITYTDGIDEAANSESEQFGIKRFKEMILKTRSLSPGEAQQSIVTEVKRWLAGGRENASSEELDKVKAGDDITVAIVDIGKG